MVKNLNEILLLPQFIKNKWTSNNREYYESKGYIFTHYNDEFDMNVLDLTNNNGNMVKCICQVCGKVIKKQYRQILTLNKIECFECKHKDTIAFYNNYKYVSILNKYINLNKYITIKWNSYLKDWYINKGYIYDKSNSIKEFNVKISDLLIGTRNKINIHCDFCYEEYEISYSKLIYKIKNNDTICCEKCKGTKAKNTCIKKYRVDSPSKSPIIKQKSIQTNLIKYGVPHHMQIEKIKNRILIKGNLTMYKNGTAPCSKQQKHIHELIGGELNYPISRIRLDIAFPNEMVYIEYNGGGHNLRVIHGDITQEEFEIQEIHRKRYLQGKGWKIIRIECKNDKLPQDDKLLSLIFECKEYLLNSNHSWIDINLNENKVICSQFKKDILF